MLLKEWINENKTNFTRSDLRFLLKELLGKEKKSLLNGDVILNGRKTAFLSKVKNSYLKGVPIGYLLKKEEFFGLEFMVNPSVLIPRPDTEVIAEKAIEVIRNNNLENILDLCCGSGIIAISIKKSFKEKIRLTASDISQKALKVARNNIKNHNIRVKAVKSNLFAAFKNIKFDLIVSNPPYLKKSEIKGSLRYEPRKALFGGNSGLHFIEKILKTAPDYLKDNGFLIIEAGYNQKVPVKAILEKTGKYEIIEWIKDYGGNFRGVILKKHG